MKYLSLILFIYFFTGCTSESNEFFDPTYWSDHYKGITFTDKFGLILKNDPNDWCVEYGDPIDSSQIRPNVGTYTFIPAYPNPVNRNTDVLNIGFYTGEVSVIKIYISDIEYSIVKVIVDSTFNRGLYIIHWNLEDSLGRKVPGGIYRCFMKAADFSCHGDIWIK